jgi:hypothetical protein
MSRGEAKLGERKEASHKHRKSENLNLDLLEIRIAHDKVTLH